MLTLFHVALSWNKACRALNIEIIVVQTMIVSKNIDIYLTSEKITRSQVSTHRFTTKASCGIFNI